MYASPLPPALTPTFAPPFPLREAFARFLRSPECERYLETHVQVLSRGRDGRAEKVSIPNLSGVFAVNQLLVERLGVDPRYMTPDELELALGDLGAARSSNDVGNLLAQLEIWWRYLGRAWGALETDEMCAWLSDPYTLARLHPLAPRATLYA